MKILVVSIQRIGDVLLTTPLIHSLKNAYPNASIDIMVCNDTASILDGNEDINKVIKIPRNSKKNERIKEIYKLWNKYDIAITTNPSDRARIYAWASSKKHYGTYSEKDSFIFKKMMSKRVLFDNQSIHTVEMNLKICELLDIPQKEKVIPPKNLKNSKKFEIKPPYVVVHPYPKFVYKSWVVSEWQAILKELTQNGMHVVISGGPDKEEIEYCEKLVISPNIKNWAGKYSLADMTELIQHAELFIGVDTSVTHLAAATGVKVFAIYGPTNPVKWAPWPYSPKTQNQPIWLSHSNTPQEHSNITLIQGQQSCVPCAEEGCDRHVNSLSQCLTSLKSEIVLSEVKHYLKSRGIGDSL